VTTCTARRTNVSDDARVKFRFAVGIGDKICSTIWTVASRNDDVYASPREPQLSRHFRSKLSFHASGICHEKNLVSSAPRPTNFRWRRAPTPSAGVAIAAALSFPTDYISEPRPPSDRPLTIIRSAAPGNARWVVFAFTRDPEAEVRASLADRCLHLYGPLRSGERFIIWSHEEPYLLGDIDRPLAEHGRHYRFSATDAGPIGRHVVLRLAQPPSDGGVLLVTELTGYRVAP
jgi:hypothetical protein